MGLLLPPPATIKTADNGHPEPGNEVQPTDFQQGLDFLQLQFPESSNNAGKSPLQQDTYSEELLHTVILV